MRAVQRRFTLQKNSICIVTSTLGRLARCDMPLATSRAAATVMRRTVSTAQKEQDEEEVYVQDWSYMGLSRQAFDKEVSDKLLAPLDSNIIEIKPDGQLYLPEIFYRRILNASFGPGK